MRGGAGIAAVDGGISAAAHCRRLDNCLQHTADAFVEYRKRQFAAFNRVQNGLDVSRAWLIEIVAGGKRLNLIIGCAPVGNDEAVEAPVLAQHICQQPVVHGAGFTVDLVVRAHDAANLALLYAGAEAGEVELAQRALSYADVDGVTAGFLIVRRKVLDVCKRALFLNALDEFRRKLRRQAGILAVAFENTAVERIPVQIDGRRAQHDVNVVGIHFPADGTGALVNRFAVPCRAQQHASGEGTRCLRLRDDFPHFCAGGIINCLFLFGQLLSLVKLDQNPLDCTGADGAEHTDLDAGLTAHTQPRQKIAVILYQVDAGAAVQKPNGRDAEALDCAGRKGGAACYQAGLFLKRHFGNNCLNGAEISQLCCHSRPSFLSA